MTTDRLVAGSVSKNPQDMKPSQEAGMNAAMVAIMASDPIDPYGANVAAAAMEPMPTIRIQVEPVKAISVPTKVPPVPDYYIMQYTMTTAGGHTFWYTSSITYCTLDEIQSAAAGKPNARIIFIPGGAA